MMSKYKQIEQYMQPPFFIEPVKKGAAEAARRRTERRREGRPGEGRAEEPQGFEAQGRGRDGGEDLARELFDYVLNEGRKDYTSSATKVWAR